jgi:hypothetical protein
MQINTLLFSYEISEDQNMFKQMNNSIFKNSFKTTNYLEEDNFKDILINAEGGYTLSENKYNEIFTQYKDISRYSNKDEIESY